MSKDLSVRALPRVFLPGADLTLGEVELPKAEADKLRKVLRLGTGDPIAILPNDGSLWRCRLEGLRAVPEMQEWPGTEPELKITLAQALPKPDRLETVLRMGTELGVARFLLFPAERSVVRWESGKLESKLHRLKTIIQEAAEQSYRCRLPELEVGPSLGEVLKQEPEAVVLSETEGTERTLLEAVPSEARSVTLVVGPEGGWSPKELRLIGAIPHPQPLSQGKRGENSCQRERGVTLGPLVLRTDTAGPAAAAALLFRSYSLARVTPDSEIL